MFGFIIPLVLTIVLYLVHYETKNMVAAQSEAVTLVLNLLWVISAVMIWLSWALA